MIKPLAFICSPYSGDVEQNLKIAKALSLWAVLNQYIPIAPHLLYPQFLDDKNHIQRELGMECSFHILKKCDWIIFYDSVKCSKGMEFERGFAIKHNIPFIYVSKNQIQGYLDDEA